MKTVTAIIISISCLEADKECYVVHYEHNHKYYNDTLYLPKNTFKQQDTVLYTIDLMVYKSR